VLRPEQTVLAGLLAEEGLRIVSCAEARDGMGCSLAAGVAASPNAAGWLVALGDMPFIQPETLREVSRVLEAGASLAAPWLDGRRGHPVGFAAGWREDLLALAGDAGARDILAGHPRAMVRIETTDAGVLRDVDTPEDPCRLRLADSARGRQPAGQGGEEQVGVHRLGHKVAHAGMQAALPVFVEGIGT
jgi:molybdenum cofactor cytidylyltransferase